MEILGYSLALSIGLVMGMIGAGGSILAVPILVYLLEVDKVPATGYSLFIVGVTAVFGVYQYWKRKQFDLEIAVWFGIPALTSVFLTRKLILPAMPDTIFDFGNFVLTKEVMVMILFSILMIAASISMIFPFSKEAVGQRKRPNPFTTLLEGAVIGILTGMVGAGGGFLIIPVLVMICKLDMKTAVGTSLMIIAAKSLIGFTGEVWAHPNNMDWFLLIGFTSLSILGSLIGSRLSTKVSGKTLKPVFGVFVLLTGCFIIYKELSAGFQ